MAHSKEVQFEMTDQIEINSFITTNGVPTTSLPSGYPKIRIWSINGSVYTLVVGTPDGSGQNTDGVMNLVTASGQQDGFWSFVFTSTIGYDITKKYLTRVDSGPMQNANERYQTAEIDPSGNIDPTSIAAAVWEEPQASHVTPGSMGNTLNQILTDQTSLLVSVADILGLVNLLAKYETNRTKIDTANKQLIVYDNDCTTVLRVFQLYDSLGQPSTDQVCERVPIAQTDGLPTC